MENLAVRPHSPQFLHFGFTHLAAAQNDHAKAAHTDENRNGIIPDMRAIMQVQRFEGEILQDFETTRGDQAAIEFQPPECFQRRDRFETWLRETD